MVVPPSPSLKRKQRRFWTAFRTGVFATCANLDSGTDLVAPISPPPGLDTSTKHDKLDDRSVSELVTPADHIEIDYDSFAFYLAKKDVACGSTAGFRFDDVSVDPTPSPSACCGSSTRDGMASSMGSFTSVFTRPQGLGDTGGGRAPFT